MSTSYGYDITVSSQRWVERSCLCLLISGIPVDVDTDVDLAGALALVMEPGAYLP
jgi:hypothetical protein